MPNPNVFRKLIGKVEISGELQCLTGLHIGASKENVEIGALDSPVVRDPVTQAPYIPGSSLKGKLRALLEKAHPDLLPNRSGGSGIRRHECDDWERKDGEGGETPGALHCPVCRLFGSTGPSARNYPARLKVRDLHLENMEELEKIDTGLYLTEWKFENGIDRVTSAANPRNIERVPRGARFAFSMIYDVEDPETMKTDLENLNLAIRLLHDDFLGGHGSRGYGQVKLSFQAIDARRIDHYRGKEGQARRIKAEDLTSVIDELHAFFSQDGR